MVRLVVPVSGRDGWVVLAKTSVKSTELVVGSVNGKGMFKWMFGVSLRV